MWSINFDEAFVLDFLSILIVKEGRVSDPDKKALLLNEIQRLTKEISDIYGKKKTDKILDSKEFLKLVATNEEVFDLVDLAEKSKGLAKEVANANIKRWVTKNKIQKKFFGKSVKEIKVSKIK